MSVSASTRFTLALQKTFAATTTSTKLLYIDWRATLPGGSLVAIGDGVTLPLMSQQASPTVGFTRSYFLVSASSLAVLRLEWSGVGLVGSHPTFYVDNIAVTNVPPSIGTLRQQSRSLPLVGSAPTPGTLKIESETAALGDGVLVYTFPSSEDVNGYSPPLRPFRTSGGTVTSDSAMVSGAREPIGGLGVGFSIPNILLPAGEYLLMARMKLSSAGSNTGTITTTVGSSLPAAAGVDHFSTVTVNDTWQTVPVVRLILPPVDVPRGSSASTSITVNTTGAGWSLTALLDEVWLFNLSIGSLIHVNMGTGAGSVGGPGRRLFVTPPSTDVPRPRLLMGHSADGSDSFYPSGTGVGYVHAWEQPRFVPPQVNLFFVTPNATDAMASLSYFPRWHTNAAS